MSIASETRLTIAQAFDRLLRDGMPIRFEAFDGSSLGPEDSLLRLRLLNDLYPDKQPVAGEKIKVVQ